LSNELLKQKCQPEDSPTAGTFTGQGSSQPDAGLDLAQDALADVPRHESDSNTEDERHVCRNDREGLIDTGVDSDSYRVRFQNIHRLKWGCGEAR
jgi:hypothetical protein